MFLRMPTTEAAETTNDDADTSADAGRKRHRSDLIERRGTGASEESAGRRATARNCALRAETRAEAELDRLVRTPTTISGPRRGPGNRAARTRSLRRPSANGATAEQLSWLQWQIDSNRKMRASERTSQQALQHRPRHRRTAANSDGFLTENHAAEALQALRRGGRTDHSPKCVLRRRSNPAAHGLLRVLLGEDMPWNGNIKPKAKSGAPVRPMPAPTRVPRGRSPTMARSDVHAQSQAARAEQWKSRERLDGC